jgi:uncharacterized protein
VFPSAMTFTLTHLASSRHAELRRITTRHPQEGAVRVAVPLAIMILILVTLFLAMPRPAQAMETDEFSDAHGVYEFADGTLLTLYGAHPMLEVGDEEIHLAAIGPDRYQAASGSPDTVTFIRDGSGGVSAVEFARDGEQPRLATPVRPYDERGVTFTSAGVELAGSLLVPSGSGPYPAVAIVHGAEFGTRETYRLLASHLARRGVAALIYDKRGTGESTGDFFSATFDDLTDDALAAVSLLRGQPEIDAARVGLAGLSQGGWIIASAATRSTDVAFLVTISASGFTPAEQAAWLTGSMLAVRGFDQPDIDRSARAWAMLYSTRDLIDAGLMEPMPRVPGFWFHALDPDLSAADLWERVEQPVLGLWGELDCQVPAYDSLVVLRGALERGPNQHSTLRIYAGADHGMALVGPCEREIGFTHGGRHSYPDGYLAAPAEWISSLGNSGPSADVTLPAERAASPLGWHQSTSTQPPWHGSFAMQIGVLALLVGGFGMLSIASMARLARLRFVRRSRVEAPAILMTVTVSAGFLATLAGALALVEMLTLADLSSRPLLDGPTVSGTTLLARIAGVTAAAAIVLGGLTVAAALRRGTIVRRTDAQAIGAASLIGLLAYWSIYWGLIGVPGIS